MQSFVLYQSLAVLNLRTVKGLVYSKRNCCNTFGSLLAQSTTRTKLITNPRPVLFHPRRSKGLVLEMSDYSTNANDGADDIPSTPSVRRSSRKRSSLTKLVDATTNDPDLTSSDHKKRSTSKLNRKKATKTSKKINPESDPEDNDDEDELPAETQPTSVEKERSRKTNVSNTNPVEKSKNGSNEIKSENKSESQDEEKEEPSSKKSKKSKTKSSQKQSPVKKIINDTRPSNETESQVIDEDQKSTKPKKSPPHQVLTERDTIPKLWNPEMSSKAGSYTFKIASWNVAGLRAVLNKTPNVFTEFVQKHDLDVLCLQETKLQESHLDDPKLKIRGYLLEDAGYDSYYSCSTTKKGYSGTAVFIKRRGKSGQKQQKSLTSFFSKSSDDTKSKTEQSTAVNTKFLVPENVSYKMGIEKHDGEGRLIIIDYPLFTMCNVYVPNSGQSLDRLTYRTEEWDKDFLQLMQQKQSDRKVPVLWLGDLNVAHTNLEVWNDGAKHLPKQAGVTPEERASFQQQLDSGFIDAFRKLHPTAAGHYSYWSQRAGNRAPNKGLRLDYFICDPRLFDESSQVVIRDSYIDFLQEGSDHCPVILELEIKNSAA